MICSTLALVATLYGGTEVEKARKAERLAARQYAIVSVDETVPNAGLMTYVLDRPSAMETWLLAKLITSVEANGQEFTPDHASRVQPRLPPPRTPRGRPVPPPARGPRIPGQTIRALPPAAPDEDMRGFVNGRLGSSVARPSRAKVWMPMAG